VLSFQRLAPGAGTVTVGNVLAALFTIPPSPSTVYAIKRQLVDLAVAHPAGIGYLHVISPAGDITGIPSAESRRAFGELATALRGQIQAVSLVFDRVGFRAAAVRAVAAGVFLAARISHPTNVASTVSDGALWLTKHFRGTASATQLTEAVAQLRVELR